MAEKSTRTAILIAIPLTIIGIWVFCWFWSPWCWFCRPCKECQECVKCPSTTSAAQIVVEDIHSAVWMVSDNSWIDELGTEAVCKDPTGEAFGDCQSSYEAHGEDQVYRPSVLYQIGHLEEDEVPQSHFSLVRISFSDDSDPIELEAGQFDWLDVNAAGKDCPIDAKHAYSMFHNGLVETECDNAAVTVSGNPAPSTCLRDRGLHASLKPDIGLITYWPGVDLYSVDAVETGASDHTHIGYIFDAANEVTVDHWLEGCFLGRHSNVKEIRIVYEIGGSAHTIFHNPPMDGAGISVFGP